LTASAGSATPAGDGGPRPTAVVVALAVVAFGLCAVLVALGTWQVERRAWKLDLIARVEQRVHAAPVAAPASGEWPRVSAARDEYRHVRMAGRFLHDRETLVQAVTALGAGYWVLTPLQAADGAVVLVNRGFVPAQQRDRRKRSAGAPGSEKGTTTIVTVIGLLRMSEPGGAFLRRNDPAADRWYSRDVQAIAASRGLTGVAPYFVDADADGGAASRANGEPGGADNEPFGGLTVTAFHNNHLAYALTWYALALMVAAAAGHLLRLERQLRRGRAHADARGTRRADESAMPD
jgi:surfeit locus 1 family protein